MNTLFLAESPHLGCVVPYLLLQLAIKPMLLGMSENVKPIDAVQPDFGDQVLTITYQMIRRHSVA